MPQNCRPNSIFIAVLVVCGVLLYFNNLYVPFVYDDLMQITGNPRLQNPTGIADAVITDYRTNRTFQNLTFAINWALTPNSPVSFHLFNNLLHIVNSVLLFLLLTAFVKVRYLAHLTSFSS